MLDAREKWLALSLWFRLKGWPTAAEVLAHSLQDKPSSPYMLYSAVSKVKYSRDYRLALNKFLDGLPKGRWTSFRFKKVGSIKFESSQDLWYALHDAELWVRGSVCRKTWNVESKAGLDIEVRDDYDFHNHGAEYLKDHPNDPWWLTLGNNMAYMDYRMGVIQGFLSVVEFHENNVKIRW